MMLSVGLDIATCTGMALVGEGEDRGKTIHLKTMTGYARLQSVAAEVERTLTTWQPQLVMVEHYAYSKNISSFIRLVEFGTLIRMTLHKLHLPWVEVTPSTLKKWTTGKGNAPKEDMAVAVSKRWNYASKSHDIVDAYALAQMGQLPISELQTIKGVFFDGPERFFVDKGTNQK